MNDLRARLNVVSGGEVTILKIIVLVILGFLLHAYSGLDLDSAKFWLPMAVAALAAII